MQHKFSFSDEAFRLVLADLRDLAASTCEVPYACGLVCSTVANLIGAAGSYGGSGQTNAMRDVEKLGFVPEFYAGGIRVSWPGDVAAPAAAAA